MASEFVCSKCGRDVERCDWTRVLSPWIHTDDHGTMCKDAFPTTAEIRNEVIRRKKENI